jgi:transcriptional regulator with XRE-family HTH domain
MVNFALMKGSGQETLAEFVLRVRRDKRLSLNDVAERGKISNAYVSKIENGLSIKPSLPRLRALAKGLEVDPEELIAVANGKPLDEASKLKIRFSSLLDHIEQLKPSDKEFVLRGLEALDAQVLKTIEEYNRAPALFGIDGNQDINPRDLMRAIKQDYPDFDGADILDIFSNHDIEKYTPEQIAIVRNYEDRLKKKDSCNALINAS